jgi:hypothetical protein
MQRHQHQKVERNPEMPFDISIGMREFGNLILLGSKPLPTAKAEIWACKILPGL